VVTPLTPQRYAMLVRNLFYTGVARSKRPIVLIGQRRALAIVMRNRGGGRRCSNMRELLALDRAASNSP
jgi:exodeoxyribonuclease V alpha subunit